MIKDSIFKDSVSIDKEGRGYSNSMIRKGIFIQELMNFPQWIIWFYLFLHGSFGFVGKNPSNKTDEMKFDFDVDVEEDADVDTRRRRCTPACHNSRPFCMGRCVYGGRGCFFHPCSMTPFRSLIREAFKNWGGVFLTVQTSHKQQENFHTFFLTLP